METRDWQWVGDGALLRSFVGDLEDANRRALTFFRDLEARRLGEVADLVPAARSVLVVLRDGAAPSDELLQFLDTGSPPDETPPESSLHEIAVAYGAGHGPDLADVAASSGMTADEVVRMHTEPIYTVAFIGFAPGFPYLIGLPDALATPRLDTPRTRVPAGSVGIGGGWTGIYPHATPGGWRIIGRAEASLFDPIRDPPAFLAPGDRVRFVAG